MSKKSKKRIDDLQKKLKHACEKFDEYIQENGSSEKLKKKSRLVTEKVKKLASKEKE